VWEEVREGEERLMGATVKQQQQQKIPSWGMLPGDQRRVTSSQRLEQPMK
jgi:hypothetical protein